jgi:hypothetical protein
MALVSLNSEEVRNEEELQIKDFLLLIFFLLDHMNTKFWLENIKGKDHMQNVSTDAWMLWILGKEDLKA